MQNIKNFQKNQATSEQIKAFGNIPLFLISEDGQDWYECQKLFADDTVKIQYNANGVIFSVVDRPIPQRGNVYAVSMLWPLGASVAEIAVADYPPGVTLDGTWRFDGHKVYRDAELVAQRMLRLNTRERTRLAAQAALTISTLQNRISIGRARDGDADVLTAWQNYLIDLDELTDAQLASADFVFPSTPQ